MAFSKTNSTIFTVLEDGQIQVRESDNIFEDGEKLAERFRRYVLDPGVDDQRNLSAEGKDPRLVAVRNTLWTPTVISDRKAKIKADQDARSAKLAQEATTVP